MITMRMLVAAAMLLSVTITRLQSLTVVRHVPASFSDADSALPPSSASTGGHLLRAIIDRWQNASRPPDLYQGELEHENTEDTRRTCYKT